jgi:hypothetical protein
VISICCTDRAGAKVEVIIIKWIDTMDDIFSLVESALKAALAYTGKF